MTPAQKQQKLLEKEVSFHFNEGLTALQDDNENDDKTFWTVYLTCKTCKVE